MYAELLDRTRWCQEWGRFSSSAVKIVSKLGCFNTRALFIPFRRRGVKWTLFRQGVFVCTQFSVWITWKLTVNGAEPGGDTRGVIRISMFATRRTKTSHQTFCRQTAMQTRAIAEWRFSGMEITPPKLLLYLPCYVCCFHVYPHCAEPDARAWE